MKAGFSACKLKAPFKSELRTGNRPIMGILRLSVRGVLESAIPSNARIIGSFLKYNEACVGKTDMSKFWPD